MSKQSLAKTTGPVIHGASELSSVLIKSYNLEIRDDDGFVGDKASKGAFLDILDDLRRKLYKEPDDPIGVPTEELSKKKIDALLIGGDLRQASLVHSAVEDFAQRLASVVRRFLRVKGWSDIERVVVGGGFRQSRVGELSIGRANILLQAEGRSVELTPIRFDPDEAGLIGCAHLAPSWMFEAYDSLLAVDIGGTNMRAGVVRLNQKDAPDLSKAEVWKYELWKHTVDEPMRDEAIERLGEMLRDLLSAAKRKKRKIAPFIGVGCPGVILNDGSIDRGAQNLPGNWHSSRFNIIADLKKLIPTIGDHETLIVLHNDAVIQGLSQTPFVQDLDSWGVLTIGTGLGNATFENKSRPRTRPR